jgi:hypothetical protein
LVRFTEPPSDVGTEGPQIAPPAAPADEALADDAPADDAVALATSADDESGASPGNWSGVSGLLDGTEPPDDAPVAPDELDRAVAPVADDPVAIEPVVLLVAAVLVPVVDVDDMDAGAPVALDVVPLPGTAVVVLSDVVPLAAVPSELVVVIPCALVDVVVVCAWSAVA